MLLRLRLLTAAVLGTLLLTLAPAALAQSSADEPFSGHGMWIWQVSRAAGGDPAGIAEQARAAGIDTVIIKGADGPTAWSQFSPELVSALQADGLTVCAYQRLKGRRPVAEAAAAARAIETGGAECFVIDAESELNGRYPQARRYVQELRRRIGADFPVAFTSYPYLDLHPLVPVSVFLADGAATVNMPQIYWKDIGHKPAAAFARTVATNMVYGRPLAPIGQLYESPSTADVLAFRRLAESYGVTGLSWWSWDSARASGWRALARPITPSALPAATPTYPTVRPGARSDVVVWAKDHLRAQGYAVTGDTRFDAKTRRAVMAFQGAAGLPATGVLDPSTWQALLAD